ncbi:hypothetical protein KIPB_011434, partial [Kipferlia bialata]|eukprot:g11434.t1
MDRMRDRERDLDNDLRRGHLIPQGSHSSPNLNNLSLRTMHTTTGINLRPDQLLSSTAAVSLSQLPSHTAPGGRRGSHSAQRRRGHSALGHTIGGMGALGSLPLLPSQYTPRASVEDMLGVTVDSRETLQALQAKSPEDNDGMLTQRTISRNRATAAMYGRDHTLSDSESESEGEIGYQKSLFFSNNNASQRLRPGSSSKGTLK